MHTLYGTGALLIAGSLKFVYTFCVALRVTPWSFLSLKLAIRTPSNYRFGYPPLTVRNRTLQIYFASFPLVQSLHSHFPLGHAHPVPSGPHALQKPQPSSQIKEL